VFERDDSPSRLP